MYIVSSFTALDSHNFQPILLSMVVGLAIQVFVGNIRKERMACS